MGTPPMLGRAKMQTTVEFLDAVKEKHGIPSDNQLAIRLGSTRSSVSNYRGKKNYLEDEVAVKVAALLEIDPAYVMACIHAEREKNQEVKKVWSRMAERLSIAAALVAVALIAPALPWDNSGALLLAAFTTGTPSLYIMSNYWPMLLVLAVALAWAFPHNPRPKK